MLRGNFVSEVRSGTLNDDQIVASVTTNVSRYYGTVIGFKDVHRFRRPDLSLLVATLRN